MQIMILHFLDIFGQMHILTLRGAQGSGRATKPFATVVPVERHAAAGGPSVCSAKVPVEKHATVW